MLEILGRKLNERRYCNYFINKTLIVKCRTIDEVAVNMTDVLPLTFRAFPNQMSMMERVY